MGKVAWTSLLPGSDIAPQRQITRAVLVGTAVMVDGRLVILCGIVESHDRGEEHGNW
jgi:hypothetical protein